MKALVIILEYLNRRIKTFAKKFLKLLVDLHEMYLFYCNVVNAFIYQNCIRVHSLTEVNILLWNAFCIKEKKKIVSFPF